MKSPEENGLRAPVTEAEKTLLLVASLPAPEGLVDRVQEELRAAPRGHLLQWPNALLPGAWGLSPALRGAAAAAIVCIVAGGGWRIYSHVQTPAAPTANVVVMPARVGIKGGFSNAGAMRTPDTLAKPRADPRGYAGGCLAGAQPACQAPQASPPPHRAAASRSATLAFYASRAIALNSMPSSASTTAPQNAGTIP